MPVPTRFASPPHSVCILRLSAIGDACHAAAALHALQSAWPATQFAWIIGTLEARLMSAVLTGVEFITFDKHSMTRELLRLRRMLATRRFDVLLDLQLSLRASVVSTLVKSPLKLGFDRRRARELQWMFTNAKIPAAAAPEHVLDSFFGFVRALGVTPPHASWNIRLPADASAYAQAIIPDTRPTLVLSPCSSHPLRNWPAERYAAVAAHAASVHGMRIVLAGGKSAQERRVGDAIKTAAPAIAVVDQIGKDTLPQLLALLAKSTVLLSPDSGPVHMATMVGTPVIGLYAATRSARAGPYYSRPWCVDKYDAASRQVFGKPAKLIPWTTKIEKPGVMELIAVSDVTERLDALMAQSEIR